MKIGDKAVVVGNDSYHCWNIGDIVTIDDVVDTQNGVFYDAYCKDGIEQRLCKSDLMSELDFNSRGLDLPYTQVKQFHQAFNHPVASSPKALDLDRATARASWRGEEIVEYLYASTNGDKKAFDTAVLKLVTRISATAVRLKKDKPAIDSILVSQVDALADEVYFAMGDFVEMGIKPQVIFDIVQEANMAKLFPDGKPRYQAGDGKIIKPDGWKAPEEFIKAAVKAQGGK